MKTINIVADGRRRCEDVGNAHAPGVYCAPSRTAIFTGRYASTTGCYRNEIHYDDHPDLVPLQTAFHRSGNATFGSGRLVHHREGYPDRSGWDEFFVRNDTLKQKGWRIETWPMAEDERDVPFPDPFPASIDNKGREVTGGLFLEWGSIPNDREKEMADTRRVNDACEVLKREHDKPFFPAVGLYAPHFPNYAPQTYFDLYDAEEIQPPPWTGRASGGSCGNRRARWSSRAEVRTRSKPRRPPSGSSRKSSNSRPVTRGRRWSRSRRASRRWSPCGRRWATPTPASRRGGWTTG